MTSTSLFLFVLHFILLPVVSAVPSATAFQACNAISSKLPDRVSNYPIGLTYITETQKYWSSALRDLKPACVVLPTTAAEVSTIVQVLNEYPDVNFAVKSGGHDPNPGHGSIDGGVLIAMREIAGATYDAATGLAYVKPGGEWNDVIGDLEPSGVTIVGGRLGIVGVGGYLLQGGVSFLSAQYGLAADSIVGWETVMANGSIVNVDAAKQPDVAVAMRGSGSQFGIVTQFTVKAHPIGAVWGGMRIYPEAQRDALFAALHDFVPGGAADPKAAIIFSDVVAVESLPIFLIFYFYDGSTEPTDGPLADFLAIPSLLDITSSQKYSALLQANGAGASLTNGRVSFSTFTIPYIASNPGIYAEISAKWHNITSGYLNDILHLTSQCSVDFQPLPSIVGQHSEAAGGNAMGLTGNDPDRIMLELQCMWSDADDDGILYAYSEQMEDWLASKLPEWLAEAGAENYMPLFMNDAMGSQNVTGTYARYAEFKALQENLDPQGFFSKRAGGFKY